MAGLIVPVVFDEDALITDLQHLPDTAATALGELRTQAKRDGGIPYERLNGCQQGEARDGTNLTGCVKTYVHWPTGPWGIIFRAGEDPKRPFALYTIAYGRRHPTGPGQLSVYQVAHQRLRG